MYNEDTNRRILKKSEELVKKDRRHLLYAFENFITMVENHDKWENGVYKGDIKDVFKGIISILDFLIKDFEVKIKDDFTLKDYYEGLRFIIEGEDDYLLECILEDVHAKLEDGMTITYYVDNLKSIKEECEGMLNGCK